MGLVLLGCGDDGDSASPLVSSEVLDFGQTDCGTVQVPRSLLLANPGSQAFTFTTSFATGTHYMVQPSAGFVLPGQQVELTVFSASIPRVSAITPNLYGDTLTVTTDLPGDEPHAIAIEQTARGAILELSTPTVTIPGTHVLGSTATAGLTIRNVGNAPATDVVVASAGSFTFAPAAIPSIAAGDEVAGTLTYAASSSGAESSPISITSAEGALCGRLPAPTVATSSGSFKGAVPTKIILVPGVEYRDDKSTLFALLPGGRVASLGPNVRGLRGGGSHFVASDEPNLVVTAGDRPLDGVVDIAGGRGAACALRSDGSVYCWGNENLVRDDDIAVAQPFARPIVSSGATAIAMGYGLRCIAKNPGGVVTCTGAQNHARPSTWSVTNATQLSLHTLGGYAKLADGTVVSFGNPPSGGGDVINLAANVAAPVPNLDNVTQTIAQSGKPRSGRLGGCALKTDGTVWCWGSGRHGRLGNGSSNDNAEPQQVMLDAETPLTSVTQLSGAHGHRCAVAPDNVYCWGNGRNGKLGRSASDENAYAQPVDEEIAGAISVATAKHGTCVLQATGRIVCFGQTPLSTFEPVAFDAFVAAP